MLSALAAAALVAGCGAEKKAATVDCAVADPSQSLVFAGQPAPGAPVTPQSLALTVRRVCDRVRALGLDGVGVRRQGAREVVVQLAGSPPPGGIDRLVRSAQLGFYDWEPNVYGDPDKPLASLKQAVRQASRAKPRAERDDVPPDGPSPAVRQRVGADERAIEAYYDRANDSTRAAGSPAVPRGVTVLKGEGSRGYWVIEDDLELSGTDIADPKQELDQQTNEPIVVFRFSDSGRRAFARATRREAERGKARGKDQRFAITLDGQVVSLATISYRDNPAGIDGSSGAQINGIGNVEQTQELAKNLAIGALPVDLKFVRVER